ncbi:MAG: NAD-binding protein [Proteobacteria bacterium]|nr:NAD-binding protein [Pseudomonadota bacterium]
MKYLPPLILYLIQNRTTKRNLLLLLKFFTLLVLIVTFFSIIFHVLMGFEGRQYSWVTGFYWTLTVMSTLGFGDITFHTDLGLLFSMVVLSTGIIFMLIILPFTFIQFFYAPWLEAQTKARTPREIPETVKGHVILTNLDPITQNLIKKLEQYNYEYVLIEADLQQALAYHDLGYQVVLGDPGDPETYKRVRVDNAALVVVTNDDMMNTNISFTIREVCESVPIVTNAEEEHSLDILEFAGSTYVFQFMRMLGKSLGRRTLGISMGTNIIGRFDQLLIAEAPAMRTPLEGKTLAEMRLREVTGITVVGVWERGRFTIPHPQAPITANMVLVLAGTAEQLHKYDELFCTYGAEPGKDAHVLILGGGRVGRAAAEALEEHRIAYKIVEKSQAHLEKTEKYVHGNAADIDTLHKAGIREARSVIITTHNDAINIYLTIYCRQLRPDIQIISRANTDRTISKLHRAGADLVMSYASLGADTIINLLKPNEVLTIAEGLNVFREQVKSSLAGTSLAENRIRENTGCSVIAISSQGNLNLSPDPFSPLQEGDELILIGLFEAEKSFRQHYLPVK